MRLYISTFLFVLVTNAVVQGQLLLQEEVDSLVKDVNQLAELSGPRTARQQQQGHSYPKLAINYLPEVSPVVEEHAHHHDHEHGAHSHIHLTRLDVTCDNRGMSVKLEFDGPFNGVVYSKGHFKNRNCRYVNKDSARGDYSFVVPMTDCGTVGDDRREEHETILIIQNEESVQEIWDSAKRIRCPTIITSRKKITKTVTFNPFEVQRLTIDEPRQPNIIEETKIECWMEILVGKGPCGSAVQDKIKIGEDLNAVIYVKDGGANYDILVKDCYAHDSEDLNARDGNSVHLSDDRGCPKKEKLMGLFRKTEQTCSSGADLVAFAPISAFKFADRPDVFLTCVVELCPGGCDQCPDTSITTLVTVDPPTSPTTESTTIYTTPTTKITTPTTKITTPTTKITTPTTKITTSTTKITTPKTKITTSTTTETYQNKCTPPLIGRYPKCKPAHCEFNPTGTGCGITKEEFEKNPFHVPQPPTRTRTKFTGARLTNIPRSRSRRATSKNIVIDGVGTGLHFN